MSKIDKTKPTPKPILRGTVHQAAFYSSLGAGFMLIATAHTHLGRIAVVIYVCTLASLFGISALYHRPQWEERARLLLRRLDHSSIYLLISGSATPVVLLALDGKSSETLLWTIWITAFLGIIKCVFWPNAPRILNVILYISAGLVSVPYLSEIRIGVGTLGVVLLISGGIIYSLGALVYYFRKPDPFPKTFGYHEVFHAMVVIASVLHFKVIYDLVQTH